MGTIYRFRCPVCDPPQRKEAARRSGTPLGCGLNYPYVCKAVYGRIRKGELGGDAKKALRRMLRPAIYQQTVVFRCEKCGKWKVEQDIKICRLKKGKTDRGSALDRKREALAGLRLKPLCYLDRSLYDVVWEASYPCAHCGGPTLPLPEPENLNCNRCGQPLEITMTGLWD